MVEFVDGFQESRAINDLNETESQVILRFITGLRVPLNNLYLGVP